MMVSEQVEVLRAAIVLAVVDGVVSPSERGLLTSMAGRVGVGRASLDAMIDRAIEDPGTRNELFQRSTAAPETTLELLVAAARLNAEITESEREVLVLFMNKLAIPVDHFSDIYERGIKRADALRRAKFG